MRRTAAVIGTAMFFVFVPCVVAGVVPWCISRWEFRLSFLGVELTRFVDIGADFDELLLKALQQSLSAIGPTRKRRPSAQRVRLLR